MHGPGQAKFSAVRFFGLVLAVLVAGVPWPGRAAAQTPRPALAVAPVSALGNISDVQKLVVFNSLEGELGKSYQLISQEEYSRAEEKAFAELKNEQCTAEQCIMKIQEILQVERLVVLQILREGDFTQLTLTMVRLSDRLVRPATCEKCAISDLIAKVAELVAQIVGDDLGGAAEVPTAKIAPAANPPGRRANSLILQVGTLSFSLVGEYLNAQIEEEYYGGGFVGAGYRRFFFGGFFGEAYLGSGPISGGNWWYDAALPPSGVLDVSGTYIAGVASLGYSFQIGETIFPYVAVGYGFLNLNLEFGAGAPPTSETGAFGPLGVSWDGDVETVGVEFSLTKRIMIGLGAEFFGGNVPTGERADLVKISGGTVSNGFGNGIFARIRYEL